MKRSFMSIQHKLSSLIYKKQENNEVFIERVDHQNDLHFQVDEMMIQSQCL
jgi:hypothetical protein